MSESEIRGLKALASDGSDGSVRAGSWGSISDGLEAELKASLLKEPRL